MNLKEPLTQIRETIEQAQIKAGLDTKVTIVAVTKTHPPETITAVVKAGLTQIGENRIQEAIAKFPLLPPGLTLYRRMIGHLQSNKVNKALDNFDSIDSVDSVKLARKIDGRANTLNRIIPVLLEVNTSGEAQKYGFSPDQTDAMLACTELKHLRVEGLMTVGPLTHNETRLRTSFQTLRRLMERLNREKSSTAAALTVLSMGMSGDYPLAVEEGSTMIRLGTALFGPRPK